MERVSSKTLTDGACRHVHNLLYNPGVLVYARRSSTKENKKAKEIT